MNLYREISAKILKEYIEETFLSVEPDLDKLVELRCYKTLCKIKEIIEDVCLEDEECFLKIEEIIHAFEMIGSDGGKRHDFG